MEEKDFRWAFTTFPSDQRQQATTFIQAALRERLIACAHIIPQIESHFVWENNIATAQEILITLKTSLFHSSPLYQMLTRHHPYTCPQWILIKPEGVGLPFSQWWSSALIDPPSQPT
jgi:periplasmic divalent cation tolerance protein